MNSYLLYTEDKSNYNDCVLLKVGEHQSNYVASNAFSLVQSFYEDELYPLGIYVDDKMVGFILYDYDPELSGWSFSRFMIDIHYQDNVYINRYIRYLHYG